VTTKTTRAYAQQTEQALEGQLQTIESDYQRLFEQKSAALINLLFAKLHRILIDNEVAPAQEAEWITHRVRFQTQAYDNGLEFDASAFCYNRDDNEIGALDEILSAEDYGEVETLICDLNTLYSPFGGSESLELHLVPGYYVLQR